ncbi:hypothetical protein [Novosphingobium sp.]|uniref:hypothetical protein n=1 Tax=Novosphingobium sp. TaxID=1874826 RepID=UPI002732BC0B|nr:hypothetical protein [Novosphingobium sp.]MDP3905826.1 hypothetical protein [Novosphingobium sp.]
MRRAPKIPLVSGTLYRKVAMLAVGLAVLVALFGSGDRDGAAIQLPASRAPDRAAAAAGPDPQPGGFDETAELAEPAQPAPANTGSADAPPLPPGTNLPGPAGQTAAAARPTPAQLRHLVEQSRIRSGAPAGGD